MSQFTNKYFKINLIYDYKVYNTSETLALYPMGIQFEFDLNDFFGIKKKSNSTNSILIS